MSELLNSRRKILFFINIFSMIPSESTHVLSSRHVHIDTYTQTYTHKRLLLNDMK